MWTIDDPDEMTRLLDLGVDGIMTDRPQVLKDVLLGARRVALTRRGSSPDTSFARCARRSPCRTLLVTIPPQEETSMKTAIVISGHRVDLCPLLNP